MSKQAKGLGRGLSALLGEAPVSLEPETASGAAPARLPIEFLRPNPNQPRKRFDEDALGELAQSIREKGVLQPILARAVEGETNAYEIVAGERRWRAAQRAGVHEIPVVLREFSDAEVLEIAIIENIQRADLNPIEEAAGYQALIREFGHTQERLAKSLGKSRSHVANMIRLLNLPDGVKDLLQSGRLTMGHARAMLSVENPVELARQVIEEGLTVRQTEARVRAEAEDGAGGAVDGSSKRRRGAAAPAAADADTRALQDNLAAALGMRVRLDHRGEAGAVTIEYKTLEQLDEICRRLSGNLAAAPA